MPGGKYSHRKERKNMKNLERFWKEEDGIGVVEIILILVVLIALVVIFREKITDIVSDAFSAISDNTETITGELDISGK